ncbi:hypothetical protein IC617_07130 [Neiella sp. HB171785]|uniref:Ysc84 actin-binding domain-containing protein n=1 Tax=Neiella litorisoli TaxID=2771431 RepID=A0A8J6UIV2_9GAMM|nr:YSC84-related protein [Neiella litorisoli]MBD1389193.1 hypothetical protein [Neiella litorisoli]
MIKYYRAALVCSALFLASFNTWADPAEERAEIDQESKSILQKVYKEEPAAKTLVNSSAGYATFSNVQVNLIFVAAGGGSGVVVDRSTGKRTYMSMGEGGIGLGLGAKDFRALFVFHTKEAMAQFVDDGWGFGAEADAAAKSGNKGAEASGGTTYGDITVYQLTEAGLALQATVKGTKYWKNDDLN